MRVHALHCVTCIAVGFLPAHLCSTVIAFSDAQQQLISAVASAAKGPVVALVFSGGAMDVSPLLANAKVGDEMYRSFDLKLL